MEWNTFNQSIPACIYVFLTVRDYIFMVPRALFNSHISLFSTYLTIPPGFPSGSMVKNLPANAGDRVLIPGSGRPPGGGNGNLLQYSCLGNPMDRGETGGLSPWGCKSQM